MSNLTRDEARLIIESIGGHIRKQIDDAVERELAPLRQRIQALSDEKDLLALRVRDLEGELNEKEKGTKNFRLRVAK